MAWRPSSSTQQFLAYRASSSRTSTSSSSVDDFQSVRRVSGGASDELTDCCLSERERGRSQGRGVWRPTEGLDAYLYSVCLSKGVSRVSQATVSVLFPTGRNPLDMAGGGQGPTARQQQQRLSTTRVKPKQARPPQTENPGLAVRPVRPNWCPPSVWINSEPLTEKNKRELSTP